MAGLIQRRLGDLPAEIAAQFGDREALVFRDQRFTFADVDREVDRAAKALMALGVNKRDHVSLWLNNRAEWLFIMYGLAKVGAVQVPVNTRFRTRDLDYVVRQSDSTMLITHDVCGPIDYLGMVREVVKLPTDGDVISDEGFPELRRVVILGSDDYNGTVSWDDALVKGESISDQQLAERADSVNPRDPFFIMYTSGTTGFPKGVVHNHNLIRNVMDRGELMKITEDDVILVYLPYFHAFGFSEGAMMSMVTGAKQIVTETFEPDESLALIEKEKVTISHGFEAHMQGLSNAQEVNPRDISSYRTGIFAAGMHSATPVVRKGAKVLAPLKNVSGYGMTEIWVGASNGTLDDSEEQRCESSGRPLQGYQLRIIHPETGEEQPVGQPGDLRVKGEYVMMEYYKKPKETAESFDEEGWFITGDMAEMRQDGYLRFLGRYKDMLKVGGENVDPMEVEGLLLEHPEVALVAVVGYPDERLAEVPVAFVQRKPGAKIDSDGVIDYCRGKVASFKIPRSVLFIDEFPMTASGKIRKVELRAQAVKEFSTE